MRLLPKVRGSLLTLFGQSMKYGESWDVCYTRLLREYFPLFVKEKMIRELVVLPLPPGHLDSERAINL